MLNDDKVDPRVKRTRALLQQAMIELLREKPLGSVTVQDITTRAQVNRATFYAHFEDKYALLNYMLHEMFQEKLCAALPDERASLSQANLERMIMVTCEYLGDFVDHCAPVSPFSEQATMFIQVQVVIHEMLSMWLNAAVRSGKRAADVDTTAMTTSWAIWGSAFQWARSGRKIPAQQLATQILALLIPGLRSYLLEEERHVS